MNEPHQLFITVHLKSGGLTSVEAWANKPGSEIVTNLYIEWPDLPPGTDWVLTHRRAGRKINGIEFPTRAKALAFAEMIEDLPEFKLIGVERIEDGPRWGDVDYIALRAGIDELHEKFKDAEARSLAELIYGP